MNNSLHNAVPPLKQLNIYLSPGSSYRCQRRWGTAWAVSGEKPETLPAHVIVNVVQEAAQLGLRALCLTGISNNSDPFLYAHLATLIDHIGNDDIDLCIESSGTHFNPPLGNLLARNPRCKVRIALAGANAVMHDGLFSTPGAFDAIVQTAEELSEQGTDIEFLFPVVRRNVGQIPSAIRLAEQLGVKTLIFVAVSTWAQPETKISNDRYRPLAVEEMIALGRKVERQYQPQTRVKLMFDQPPAFRGLHPSARLESLRDCAVANSLSLMPGGEIVLCGMTLFGENQAGTFEENRLVIGRAGQNSLRMLWHEHPTLLALREGRPELLAGVCERCVVQSACLGRCPIENQFRAGSFWGPYWFCEAAERAGLFPAGRLIEDSR